jgi:hypothetical protein
MDDHLLDSAFRSEYLPYWFFGGGVVLLLISSFVWWTQVYQNPYNVYWDMLASNLATASETKHLVENTNGTHLNQYIAQQFGPNTMAYGQTNLSDANSTVKTESIGTLSTDYIRYTHIQTKQKSKNGKSLSFSNVLGKWAKSPATNVAVSSSNSATPFFTQTVLGLGGGNLMPIANLTQEKRQNLMTQLHQNDVFDTSFSNVKKQTVNGRAVYIYTVSVEPVAYVALEKAFAADLGLHTLDNIDPNNYHGQQPIQVDVIVDVRSHHLTEINFNSLQHQEFYSSFGVPIQVATPQASLSSQDLQKLISQTQ